MHHTPLPSLERRQDSTTTPLIIINQCGEDIYPATGTQYGTGPASNGFKLEPGAKREQTVSQDWQGRVWGRANCSFNEAGRPASGGYKACGSGDCNGELNCKVGGDTPVTLAEFTLSSSDGQTYYDISLVDGYNMPMAVVLEPHGDTKLDDIPPNLTNPSCVATIGQLADQKFNPYTDPSQEFLGTNSTYKLPLDVKVDNDQVDSWCPWDLMTNQPKAPADGVYTYPDSNVQRPAFNPCLSACAKYHEPKDCCIGEYNSASKCPVGEYSKNAKAVCPDAYSYAFDDQTSTFIIPGGAGFQVIFCPGGRSTNILAAESSTVQDEGNGQVSYGGGGNGNNSDNKATRDCENLPVEDGKVVLNGVRVLDLKRRGQHLRDWTQAADVSKRKSNSAAILPLRSTGVAIWLYILGIFLWNST